MIRLDHRLRDQVSTRRIRVVKYRGSNHQTNEFPFLTDDGHHRRAHHVRVAGTRPSRKNGSRAASLDVMLGGAGYYHPRPDRHLLGSRGRDEALLMLVRLIDMLKSRGVTLMLSNLTRGGEALEQTRIAVSSTVDTPGCCSRSWKQTASANRCLYVLESRGMLHSNRIRELLITEHAARHGAGLGPDPGGTEQPHATVPKAVKTIERNARAQAQLISDLLDVSRIVAGKLHVEFEWWT